MSIITRFLVTGEEVLKEYKKLRVARGLGNRLEKGYTGFITNKRVIFIKKNGKRVHELTYKALSSYDWSKRRRLGKGFLLLSILLILIGFRYIAFLIIGAIMLVLWIFLKEEVLVLYGGGKEIVVAAGTRSDLDDMFIRIRNAQAMEEEIYTRRH